MASKKKKSDKRAATSGSSEGEKDMADVFEETKEDDATDAKTSASGKRVKACHLLVQEAHRHLSAARSDTAPNGIIGHLLDRVMDLTREIYEEAEAGRTALDK